MDRQGSLRPVQPCHRFSESIPTGFDRTGSFARVAADGYAAGILIQSANGPGAHVIYEGS